MTTNTQMENNFVPFNRWCSSDYRRHAWNSIPVLVMPRNNVHSDCQNENLSKPVRVARCYRCGQTDHFAKQCTSRTKLKSKKKKERDNERLRTFMSRKLCQSLPFAELDDLEFMQINKCRNGVSLYAFGLLVDKLKTAVNSKNNLDNVIDTMKQQNKDTKHKLTEQVQKLTKENKELKTKLQKSVGNQNKLRDDMDVIYHQNDQLNHVFRRAKHDKEVLQNILRTTKEQNQMEINTLTAKVKDLESKQSKMPLPPRKPKPVISSVETMKPKPPTDNESHNDAIKNKRLPPNTEDLGDNWYKRLLPNGEYQYYTTKRPNFEGINPRRRGRRK